MCTVYESINIIFIIFSLKIGLIILFIYLKIILLQYISIFNFNFQFSIQNNSKFIPYLKYFLSAFYSIHVNLLNSTPSYFTPFKLQDSPYLTWLALPTTHIFRFFSPTWNYFPSLPLAKICFQIWSLFLFLRLGIQLRFTASTPVPLFTASQICHHQCEAKVKRSQIGI